MNQQGVAFKIDFEKTYEKISWQLLFEYLQKCGFNATWCGWMN
jgi:hypothetical protein